MIGQESPIPPLDRIGGLEVDGPELLHHPHLISDVLHGLFRAYPQEDLPRSHPATIFPLVPSTFFDFFISTIFAFGYEPEVHVRISAGLALQ